MKKALMAYLSKNHFNRTSFISSPDAPELEDIHRFYQGHSGK
jgi:hypothetical protein